MAAPAFALQDVVSFDGLRRLAGAAPPCITIATALPHPLEVHARLKNAVRAVERDPAAAGLLDPIRAAAETLGASGLWGRALAIFRSPAVFEGYWLRDWRGEIHSAGDSFHLRPLLAAVSREQRFHLLAVSQGHIRLFDSTLFRAAEVPLPASMPGSLREWQNARQPDHVLDNRSPGGSSVGSMKGVVFGTGTDREKRYQYLRHFFQEVDRGVRAVLRDDGSPLVLAGVQEELAVYRRVNTYPTLSETEIHGAPDRLSAPDLLEPARDLLSRSPAEPLRKLLAGLDRSAAPPDVREILSMAREGRIEDLLISCDAEDGRLDLAAAETLRRGGRVFCVQPPEMPAGAAFRAVLRH